jgi:hypothetical protein
MIVAAGQRATKKLLFDRRIVDMSLETNVAWLDLDVLDDHRFVFDAYGIRRQGGRIDRTLDRLVDRQLFERAPIASRIRFGLLTLAPTFLGRVIRILLGAVAWARRLGFLLLLKLFLETLNLLGQRLLARHQPLHQIE